VRILTDLAVQMPVLDFLVVFSGHKLVIASCAGAFEGRN